MTDQSVHDAVWSWLLTCPHIRDLYFNYPAQRFGGTEVSPLTAHRDRPVKEFTSGVSEREYVFVLSRIAPLSDAPGSDENIIELRRAEQLAAWVDAQDAAGVYPSLPEGCTVTGVEVLPPGTGYFAARSTDGAKYQFQFSIRYLCRREEA